MNARGISQTVGGVILIAVTVLSGVTVAYMGAEMSKSTGESSTTTQASVEFEEHPDGTVTVLLVAEHNVDVVEIKNSNGDVKQLSTIGASATIQSHGKEIEVIAKTGEEDGSKKVTRTYTPSGPADLIGTVVGTATATPTLTLTLTPTPTATDSPTPTASPVPTATSTATATATPTTSPTPTATATPTPTSTPTPTATPTSTPTPTATPTSTPTPTATPTPDGCVFLC